MSPKKPPSEPPVPFRTGGWRENAPFLGAFAQILKQEDDDDVEADWQADFLLSLGGGTSAVAPLMSASGQNDSTRKRPADQDFVNMGPVGLERPEEVVNTTTSCLNTPTMDYVEPPLFSRSVVAGRKNPLLASSAGDVPPTVAFGSHIVEVVAPVVTNPPAQRHFPNVNAEFEKIYDFCAISSSPENIEDHAPLIIVEGVEPEAEKLWGKTECCATPKLENDIVSPCLAGPATTDRDPFKTESRPHKDEESGDGDETVLGELQKPNSILQWIIDDTIMPDSAFPEAQSEAMETETAGLPAATDLTPLLMLPSSSSSVMLDWYSLQTASPSSGQPAVLGDIRPPPAKRGRRGRPPVPLDRPITPRVSRTARKLTLAPADDSDFMYVTSDGYLTEEEMAKMKYRRSRDLNNVASKRCRENRKQRQIQLEQEAEQLQKKNAELRCRLSLLEARVRRVKTYFMTKMVAGGTIADPDEFERMWS